jgi:DNA-directed RNA polymerase specialized sigma24 family protein
MGKPEGPTLTTRGEELLTRETVESLQTSRTGASLSAETFMSLLNRLDTDRERAGEKYEDLRRTLIRFFEWRGAPCPDEHADEVFNRLARRLKEGIEIKSVGAYSHEVARLVFLETTKGNYSKRLSLESLQPDLIAEELTEEVAANEQRLECLEQCLRTLPRDSSELILEYYRYEGSGQVGRRRALAERLGLRRDALANRAQRLRDKLERCVSLCLRKKLAI